jgi:hypothetical protein
MFTEGKTSFMEYLNAERVSCMGSFGYLRTQTRVNSLAKIFVAVLQQPETDKVKMSALAVLITLFFLP